MYAVTSPPHYQDQTGKRAVEGGDGKRHETSPDIIPRAVRHNVRIRGDLTQRISLNGTLFGTQQRYLNR